MKREYILKELTDILSDWYGIKVPANVMDEVFGKNNAFIGEAIDFGIDTVVREEAVDIIAEYITGLSWPLGGTPEADKKKFYKALIAKAPSKGIQVEPDAYAEYVKG